jgi:hypothetical protein
MRNDLQILIIESIGPGKTITSRDIDTSHKDVQEEDAPFVVDPIGMAIQPTARNSHSRLFH